MRYFLILTIACTTTSIVMAQNVGDALRYSTIQSYGTARMQGVGNSFSALGADFGSASLNPAGMAMFRTNEFVFTPGIFSGSSTAHMDVKGASSSDDEATRFRFANGGVLFNTQKSDTRKWRTINVGMGYNQLNNFTQNVYYEGAAKGTILNGWFQTAQPFLANGGDPEKLYALGEGLAYNAGAIYFQNGVPSYDFEGNTNPLTDRTHAVTTRGSMGEMNLSWAGNYMDRVMIGASMGIPVVKYRQEGTYTEKDPTGGYTGEVNYFDNLIYTDYLRTNGIGVNAKLGLILRVNQMVRIGGAIHSPTYLNLTDNFSADLTYNYQDQPNPGEILDYSGTANATAEPFNYGLRTPWRSTFGGAFMFRDYGFVSADVEYIDYSAAHFNLTKQSNDPDTKAYERTLNASIQNTLQPAFNYKIGAEAALDVFRLRAGYNLMGKPQRSSEGFDNAFSVGAGIRKSSFYLDLALRHTNRSGSVTPYLGSDAPKGVVQSASNDVLLTVGFKF